jgi:hypothetical protein
MFNQVPLAILVWTAFWINNLSYLVTGVLLLLSVSSYSLALKIYLTGLQPNVLLYNAKIFLVYLLLGVPVLLILIFLSIINPLYLFASPVLILVSFFVVKKSYVKWDNKDQPSF